jgi:hypothetical protein
MGRRQTKKEMMIEGQRRRPTIPQRAPSKQRDLARVWKNRAGRASNGSERRKCAGSEAKTMAGMSGAPREGAERGPLWRGRLVG